MGWIDGEAYACADLQREATEDHRGAERIDDALADRSRRVLVRLILDESDKLVAAIARRQRAVARGIRKPYRHLFQHQIPDEMSVPVVDRLKSVEVDDE